MPRITQGTSVRCPPHEIRSEILILLVSSVVVIAISVGHRNHPGQRHLRESSTRAHDTSRADHCGQETTPRHRHPLRPAKLSGASESLAPRPLPDGLKQAGVDRFGRNHVAFTLAQKSLTSGTSFRRSTSPHNFVNRGPPNDVGTSSSVRLASCEATVSSVRLDAILCRYVCGCGKEPLWTMRDIKHRGGESAGT